MYSLPGGFKKIHQETSQVGLGSLSATIMEVENYPE